MYRDLLRRIGLLNPGAMGPRRANYWMTGYPLTIGDCRGRNRPSSSTKPFSFALIVAGVLTICTGAPSSAPAIIHLSGVVSFQNTEADKAQGVASHLVTNSDNTLLVGTQYKAELYYLDTTTSTLKPLPATLSSFKASTTSEPGTWSGPAANISLPTGYGGVDVTDDPAGTFAEAGDGTGVGAGYYPVTLRVRAWDSTTAASWETATVRGESPFFTYTQRYIPAVTDTQIIGQPGFFLQEGPRITAQPQSQTVTVGTAVLLSVTVVGTPPFYYQWMFNQTNQISTATNSSLTLDHVDGTNSGAYSVIVSNALSSASSGNAVLTVLPVPFFKTVHRTNHIITLTWSAAAGQAYHLQFSTDLGSRNWNDLVTVSATNDVVTTCDDSGADPHRFYRLILLQ